MEDAIERIINRLRPGLGVTPKQIELVQQQAGFIFPDDYRNFLLYGNGAEGPIGEHGYIQLWALEELVELNQAYSVSEFAPGLFLFGSDGGDEAFGFDLRNPGMPIIQLPFIPMDLQHVKHLVATFNEFLLKLDGAH